MRTVFDWTSLVVILSTGIYLILLGVAALAVPEKASSFLKGFAASAKLHYLELSIRFMVGFALLQLADRLPGSIFFMLFGAILVSTTAILFLVPWQYHRSFAERSVPRALRYLTMIGVSSIILGSSIFICGLIGVSTF
jgi:hypothetical protein